MVMYTEIKNYILECIKKEEYYIGYKLPPEREFTEKFSASRMTVRRAVDELIQEGVLIKKKGKGITGTYVSIPKKVRSINRISISTDKELIHEYGQIRVEVLEKKLIKNHSITNKLLGLLPHEEVYQVKRVQYGWDIPIVYENIFFPLKYFPQIQEADFRQSLTTIAPLYLREGFKQGKNEVEIECLIATPRLMELLSVTRDSPILQMNIIVRDTQGVPLYCGKDSYDGNSFKYSSHNEVEE
ncbi:MAG: GntR family transcriptional regulator [Coprobacillus sp.]|nr:GntR family transcriptional regulator [Coprobacillus sp.]MCI9093038.1 GntR family transcriptional regulator [Coprobacillus sp.]